MNDSRNPTMSASALQQAARKVLATKVCWRWSNLRAATRPPHSLAGFGRVHSVPLTRDSPVSPCCHCYGPLRAGDGRVWVRQDDHWHVTRREARRSVCRRTPQKKLSKEKSHPWKPAHARLCHTLPRSCPRLHPVLRSDQDSNDSLNSISLYLFERF